MLESRVNVGLFEKKTATVATEARKCARPAYVEISGEVRRNGPILQLGDRTALDILTSTVRFLVPISEFLLVAR